MISLASNVIATPLYKLNVEINPPTKDIVVDGSISNIDNINTFYINKDFNIKSITSNNSTFGFKKMRWKKSISYWNNK